MLSNINPTQLSLFPTIKKVPILETYIFKQSFYHLSYSAKAVFLALHKKAKKNRILPETSVLYFRTKGPVSLTPKIFKKIEDEGFNVQSGLQELEGHNYISCVKKDKVSIDYLFNDNPFEFYNPFWKYYE